LKIVLYSTGCPRCNVLETKLKNKGIDFEEINDTKLMIDKGFDSVPILEVDGNYMDFGKANEFINSL
jgi:glutaredoxin